LTCKGLVIVKNINGVYGKAMYLSSIEVMQKDNLSCQTVKLSFAAAYWNYKYSLG